jgi:pimeloyl-ACP methyl ester carboxylesterase
MTEIQRIRVNGTELAYIEEGEGPLVVLCHGFPDTAHSWDRVRPVLAAAGYRAVTPFMRGYAPSPVPHDRRYGADTLGEDVVRFTDALAHGEPAVVVGHDWGASAAYSAVGLASAKFRLLVAIAIPHPAGVRPTPKLLWAVRHFVAFRMPGAADRIRRDDFALIDELVQRWSPDWDVPPGETDAVKEAFRQPGCLEAALGYYRALGLGIPRSQRRRVDVPTVCFAGLNDIVAPRQYDYAASRFNDTYEVIRMPGGHFMHREHPERFERELLDALARHAPVDD